MLYLRKVGARLTALASCCFALALACAGVSAQQSYGIVDLGTLPGGSSSLGFGINNAGQAVGYSNIPTGRHAFVYAGGSMGDLLAAFHAANGGSSEAYAVNDLGHATGLVRLSANSFQPRGFLFSGGNVAVFGVLPGGFGSQGNAVNGAGQVAGLSGSSGGNRAFLWSDGVMQDLGVLSLGTFNNSEARSINETGQVVGVSSTSTTLTNHAFLWQNGVMQDLGVLPGGGTISSAADINNLGQVVGFSNVPGPFVQVAHAFLWTSGGGMADLGTLGGSTSQARGINDSGTVIGVSTTAANVTRPFVYRNGAMTDLTTLLPAGHCFSSVDVSAVNNDGTIVGSAQLNGVFHAVMLVPGSTAGGGQNCGGPPPPPPTPSDVIAQMRAVVANVDNNGVSNSMDVKLRNVLNSMGDTNRGTACNSLAAFGSELDAQDGRHIAAADAALLRLKAAQLAGMLGCN
jgi:probable HAF family extracellular repeat protein